MKENTILLVDADGDCEELVSGAAARMGYGVRLVKTSCEAFALITHHLRQLPLVVVDVDRGAHGLALLEAISACAETPPIVVITGLEETYMEPIAREHGASACLGKPVTLEKLGSTLQNISAGRCLTCDRWGCLVPPPVDKGVNIKAATRGITAKMAATLRKRDAAGKDHDHRGGRSGCDQ